MSKIAKHFTYVCACCGEVTPFYARNRTQLAEKLQEHSQDSDQASIAVASACWRGFVVSVPGGVLIPGKFTGKTREGLLLQSAFES